MALYRIWLLSLAEKSIIYTRYFPHLEKQDGFIFPWLAPQEFIKCLYISLGIDNDLSGIPIQESSRTIFSSYDQESNVSLSKFRPSTSSLNSSSSGSITSMTSLVSSTTINTSTISKQVSFDASFCSESNILKEHSCLYNHLPLVICPVLNIRKQESSAIGRGDLQRSGHIDPLIMLVYEQNGYLFVCCPRLLAKDDEMNNVLRKYYNCEDNEKLLVNEHNLSIAYTILHMLATCFFVKNKSLKSLEWFITAYMPFGTLIRTKSNEDITILSTLYQKDTIISLRLTESISTSFKYTNTPNDLTETIFGTMTVDFLGSKLNFSKGEVVVNIENLDTLSLVLPSNCLSNDSALSYDVSHQSLYNLNVIHYESQLVPKEKKIPYSAYLDDKRTSSIPLNKNQTKLFRVKYTIHRKKNNQGSGTKSSFLTESPNIHHVNLRIMFHEKLPLDDIKFKYFIVKFGLNRGLLKKQVQTMSNSINNLVVRESMKISQGQVKNENNMLIWIIGSIIPKSKILSIDFDLMINQENLVNLETQCNFSHSFHFKCLLSEKPINVRPSNSSRMLTINEERIKLKECKLTYPIEMIPPYLKLSKISLMLDMVTKNVIPKKQSDSSKSSSTNGQLVQFDYHLNSFEYRLFPVFFE